ncbi:MAG: hypothetical protein JXR52_08900 [Bacteroidales bacterium]|nr:hypothetical protein [Bacteroidales bacterium]MBN2698931.1 hypothetical protein [Bacteroidales bacterium]
MNTKIERSLAMQRSVIKVMEKHLPSWQNIIELKSNYDDLVMNFKKLADCEKELKIDSANLYSEEEKSRVELIERLFPVASVISVFASDRGKRKLYNLTNISYSDLEKKKSKALQKMAAGLLKRIGKLAKGTDESAQRSEKEQTHVKTLSEYGLTKNHLQALETALDSLGEDVKKIKKYLIRREANKRKANSLILKNERILGNKLDKMMALFKNGDSPFYNEYLSARKKENKAVQKASASEKGSAPVKPATGKKTAKPTVKKISTEEPPVTGPDHSGEEKA